MIWQNLSELSQAHASQESQNQTLPPMPAERWGHASVAAQNKMYIIGGYQGNNNNPTPNFANFQPPLPQNSLSQLVQQSLPITAFPLLENLAPNSNQTQT
jgi:hypothetical protein